MKQELLILRWRIPLLPSRRPLSLLRPRCSSLAPVLLESSAGGGELTARERRQLRKERRESRAGERNWREEVEDRLMVRPKKEYRSWMEKLNLDKLAQLGPQWWVVRVARVNGNETADALARALIRNYPNMEFKVYYPAVKEQRKLKNGSYSMKLKPLFPGCVFLNCILNKEIHDFIRECDRVGGFIGSKVGNTKRQINRPKPVLAEEMEAIFRQAKIEQEKADQDFKEEQQKEIEMAIASESNQKQQKKNEMAIASESNLKSANIATKKQSRKGLKPSKSSPLSEEKHKSLVPGASVRVLSGPFTEFSGSLKKVNNKNGKATVGFMLFGKESFVELEVEQIVAEIT